MKDSTSRSQDFISPDHELCCQAKCANCFDLGGCIYEQYPVAPVHLAESKPENHVNDVAPLPKRA